MKLLRSIDLNDIIFIDIETVRIQDSIEKNTQLYDSWEYKLRYSKESEKFEDKSLEDLFKDKAALYAEFGKIVCITVGKIQDNVLKLKSYYSDNEQKLLSDFANGITAILSSNRKSILCGHAIKGFDVPYIMRRSLINSIEPPILVDTSTAKPWDLPLLDTMELWKGSGFYGASLLNIATAFGLPSPKSDISGSETSNVYYTEKEKGLERIKNYCEQDVICLANIVRKCRLEDTVDVDNGDMSIKKVGVLERTFNTKKLTKEDERIILRTFKEIPEDQQKAAKDILDVALPKVKK